MQNSKKNSGLFAAVITGAIVGAAVSMLYAPRSGRETRTKIRRKVEKTSRTMGNAATQLKQNMLIGMEEGGDELGYLIGSAVARTALTAKEIIKMLEKELRELKSRQETP
jgi:gas vesicle protein